MDAFILIPIISANVGVIYYIIWYIQGWAKWAGQHISSFIRRVTKKGQTYLFLFLDAYWEKHFLYSRYDVITSFNEFQHRFLRVSIKRTHFLRIDGKF